MEQDGQSWNLSEVTEEKDLGVIVSSDLKVSRQCSEAFLILYKCYVRPHLEYCIQAWSPFLRKGVFMEQVQRRATKLVEGSKKFDYDTRLKKLGLTTLEKWRIKGDLIEIFKILTDREKISKQGLFDVRQHNYYLRGHSYSLEVKRSRINICSNFFSQRTVKHWNSLSEHVVSASSVNCFKNRLDSCTEWGVSKRQLTQPVNINST